MLLTLLPQNRVSLFAVNVLKIGFKLLRADCSIIFTLKTEFLMILRCYVSGCFKDENFVLIVVSPVS